MSEERGHGKGHHHSARELLREGSNEGIRALKVSVLGLFVTSSVQFSVLAISGSVALFADALHNLGDVLTSAVLWLGLLATRRAADHRYSFGYQRFEDLAGLVVVLAIFGSAALAAYESILRLIQGGAPSHLIAGMGAGAVGFLGNEAVAQYKVRIGKRINSQALIAEGQHSRIDGLASLAVIAGLGGVAAGADWADPAAGLALVAVIVYLGIEAGRPIVATLLDKVEPDMLHRIEDAARSVDHVADVHDVRARWAGRALYVLLHVSLPSDMSLEDAHAAGEEVRHAVLHELPEAVQVDVHADPGGEQSTYHETTAHHFQSHS